MPKFIVEVEYENYPNEEEMTRHINQSYEDVVFEALRDYSFDIIRLQKIEEGT